MHLIEVRDVYKIYNPGENQVNALDGVSITIDEGEFVAIIGQSGSGKSTLMNMLGLLDTPTNGEYYINGHLVDDLTDDQMSVIRNEQIGFIFQGFNLISSLTALENVELPLVYRGMKKDERREISKAALERVGLGPRMNHLPAEMSGGQQQRVAVARAIAARPPVILADEPTGNLDTKSTKE
ncbi:MAG: ABC transporter ATP-binding protein, partial [Eubacterium sp.]|nr:ABC transporter ATP-binding protein [Eubacterium sp.]